MQSDFRRLHSTTTACYSQPGHLWMSQSKHSAKATCSSLLTMNKIPTLSLMRIFCDHLGSIKFSILHPFHFMKHFAVAYYTPEMHRKWWPWLVPTHLDLRVTGLWMAGGVFQKGKHRLAHLGHAGDQLSFSGVRILGWEVSWMSWMNEFMRSYCFRGKKKITTVCCSWGFSQCCGCLENNDDNNNRDVRLTQVH